MSKNQWLKVISLCCLIFSSAWLKTFIEKGQFIVAGCVIFSSLVLFFLEYTKNKYRYLVLFFPLVFIIFFLPQDKSIFTLSDIEIYTINQRRSYYQNNFYARFFENKINRYLYNYKKNLFEGLDINYYFFGTHPRERAGINEVKKYSFILFPLFLLGIYESVQKKKYLVIVYFIFSLVFSSFFRPIDTFSFLFTPFFVVCINTGFWNCIYRFKIDK